MKILSTSLSDLLVLETDNFGDHRGGFSRLYCDKQMSQILLNRRILQINHSFTQNIGVVRGLHVQLPPVAERKFVTGVRGKVWDIAVDLRKSSPSYLKWHAEELSSVNRRTMVIPEGFAHGYQVLDVNTELLYFHTAFYNPELESGIRYDDPILRINWPLCVVDLSERDKHHPMIDSDFPGVSL